MLTNPDLNRNGVKETIKIAEIPGDYIGPARQSQGQRIGDATREGEGGDQGLLRRIFSLPVAPSGGLEDGIQPRLLPVDGGEVQVHPGFHQGGGRHPAGEASR